MLSKFALWAQHYPNLLLREIVSGNLSTQELADATECLILVQERKIYEDTLNFLLKHEHDSVREAAVRVFLFKKPAGH